MRKPDEMADDHAVGLAEDARAAVLLLVARTPRDTDRSTVDATGTARGELVDRHPVGRVRRYDADQVIRSVSDRFGREEQGFECRLTAIRTRTATPGLRSGSAVGDSRAAMARPGAQRSITDAVDTYHLIWEPAGTGIVDFAAAVADLAVRIDTAPRTESGTGATDRGARDRQRGVVLAPVRTGTGQNPDHWGGRELLDWGASWADKMTDDLVDSIDRLLDGLESELFGPSHEANEATGADLSLVPTLVRRAGHPS